jgi:hypothetical protein
VLTSDYFVEGHRTARTAAAATATACTLEVVFFAPA